MKNDVNPVSCMHTNSEAELSKRYPLNGQKTVCFSKFVSVKLHCLKTWMQYRFWPEEHLFAYASCTERLSSFDSEIKILAVIFILLKEL